MDIERRSVVSKASTDIRLRNAVRRGLTAATPLSKNPLDRAKNRALRARAEEELIEAGEKELEQGGDQNDKQEESDPETYVLHVVGSPESELNQTTIQQLLGQMNLTQAELSSIQIPNQTTGQQFQSLMKGVGRDVALIFKDPAQSDDINLAETDPALKNRFVSSRTFQADQGVSLEIGNNKHHHHFVSQHHLKNFKQYVAPKADLAFHEIEEEAEEKSASWLELFYDLFFVANLSVFTHTHPISDSQTFLLYAGWFLVLWWSWTAQTMYGVRYDTDDYAHRVWKLVELFGFAGLAGNSGLYTTSTYKGFIVSYVTLKVVLFFQYGVVLNYARTCHAASTFPLLAYVVTNLFSIICWVITYFIPFELYVARYILWYASILVEVIVNIWFARNPSVTFVGTHVGERLGLLTIIVLGENVIGLLTLVEELVIEPGVLDYKVGFLMILGLAVIYMQWWIYFGDFNKEIFIKSSRFKMLWIFLHFPLNLSQVILGTAIDDVIREKNFQDAGENSTQAEEAATIERFMFTSRYFFVVVALVFFFNAIIKLTGAKKGDKYDRIYFFTRLVSTVICLFLLPVQYLDSGFGPISLLGTTVAICSLQIIADIVTMWLAFRYVQNHQDHQISDDEKLGMNHN